MGNTSGVTLDDVIALIHGGNEHGVEVNGPDAVIGFLQAYALSD
jgi:hypothetical protein